MNRPVTRRILLLLLAGAAVPAVFGLGGCARRSTALKPPPIHYGYDVCAWCGMVINSQHFAAALAYQRNGNSRNAVFDDIGCMLAWQKAHQDRRVLRAWVKSYATEKWVVAQQAWFVQNAAIHTPMASGIAAGATPEQARAALPRRMRTALRTMDYSMIRRLGSGEKNKAGEK